MRPSVLPTHTKAGRGPGTAVKLQSAFDKGLGMAGLKATKGGSGDKERAYIVRQNWVLKTMLLLIVVFAIGMMILFSTVLKVSVVRREAVKAEQLHHKLEHAAQVKLMRAHLELQRALEQEVHETDRLEEFRSATDRAIGEHAEAIKKQLRSEGVDEKILKEIETADDKLRVDLDMRLHKVLQHFHGLASNARNSLKRVAHAIVSDVELEKRETDRFKEKMHKFGVNVPEDEDPHKRGAVEEEDSYGLFNKDKDADEEIDDDDEEIEMELENFFKKLNKHTFPLLDQKVIDEWEKDMQDVMRTLDDEEKEVDLERLKERVNGKIAMHAPDVPKYDPAKHNSIIDYYEMRIEEAKLSFHRQSLMDLYNGWKEDKKISPFTVLSGLESIAEANNMYLLYEWLDDDEGDEDDNDWEGRVKSGQPPPKQDSK